MSASLTFIAEKLDALFQPWNRSDAPGLVVGIAVAGQPCYRRGFGLASLEQGTANTLATRMRIASTSKHFAALAALLLAEESQLDIDAPLRDYLPELVGPVGDPSLRQLMNHSGGLRDPYDLPGILLHRGFPAGIPEGMDLEVSQRFTDANFAPGERMIYCNNGYHLLSLAVERVSGQEFGSFLRERILSPLGMHDTELLRSDMHIIPRIASFHVPQTDGRWRRGIYPSEELLGSGGMVSSVGDMLAWLAHLRGDKKVGSPQTWRQMLEPTRYTSGSTGNYGLGLIRETYRGVEIVHHAGLAQGCTCQMLTVPAQALDIIIMSNRLDASAPALALKAVDAVLGESALSPAPELLPAVRHESLHGHWYAPESHRVLSVMPQAAAPEEAPVLTLAIHQQILGPLRYQGDDRAVVSPASHGMVELLLPAGQAISPKELVVRDAGHMERFRRLPDLPPKAVDVAADLLGRYRYQDLDIEVALVLDKGVLYLDLLPSYGQSRFRLEPLSAQVFGFALIGSSPILSPCTGTLVVERQGDTVSGFWLNSSRTRKLWLERLPHRGKSIPRSTEPQ